MLIPDEQVAWLRRTGAVNGQSDVIRRIDDRQMSRAEGCIYAAGKVDGMADLVVDGDSVRAAHDMLRDALSRFEVKHAAALRDPEGAR